MCRSKMAADAAPPSPHSSRATSRSDEPLRHSRLSKPLSSSSTSENSASWIYTSTSYRDSPRASLSSRPSLSSLRDSLPENPHVYDFSEICEATNQFLAKKYSSATACWRCKLRGKDVILFKRKFKGSTDMAELRDRLSVICRSHHASVIKLLGVSTYGGYIYLVYDFVNGANLSNCLRNPRNPNFTVLSTWISRIQVATDLAHGLDYIHNNSSLDISSVHNHIKSSSVIVTEPLFNAKICHFGTAQLCGEGEENKQPQSPKLSEIEEIQEGEEEKLSRSSPKKPEFKRLDNRRTQIQGARGYMSPEFQSTGIATQKSDIYAFGVVILELLSGEEPLKYKLKKDGHDFIRTSIIETARGAIGDEERGGLEAEGRLRSWVDRRLKDSYPVEVAQKLTRLALNCVHVDPDKRPDMRRVAGKISRLYMDSRKWSDRMELPTEFSISLAPR